MSPLNLAVDVLLGIGVAAELLSVAGLLLVRSAYDRLHFVGTAGVIGPAAIGSAIVMRECVSPTGGVELTSGGIEALCAAALLFLLNPVLTHAIARAARLQERGTLEPRAAERRAE
jgi:monovalent cation/proton antiporter MnhG/PhaG subunit